MNAYKEMDPVTLRHNEAVLNRVKRGDLIQIQRGIYSHWAVYVGNGMVVHLAGEEEDDFVIHCQPLHIFSICGVMFGKALVSISSFWKVVKDNKAYINNGKDDTWSILPPDEIVRRAVVSIGRVGYNLITQNCEHFAKWCRYNRVKSDQVDNALTSAAVGVASLATIGAVWALIRESKESRSKQKEH